MSRWSKCAREVAWFIICLGPLLLVSCQSSTLPPGNADVTIINADMSQPPPIPPVAFVDTNASESTVVTNTVPVQDVIEGAIPLDVKDPPDAWMHENFVYWSTFDRPCQIFRMSLQGGHDLEASESVIYTKYPCPPPDVIAQNLEIASEYMFSLPNVTHFLIDGDWLLYTDRQYGSLHPPLFLHAYNLRTGVEQTLLTEGTEALYPWFEIDGTRVVYGRSEGSEDPACPQGESFIAVYDLTTGVNRELDRVCVDNGYIWARMDISGDLVVADRWKSIAIGSGHEIVLFDLTTDEMTVINDQYLSIGGVIMSGDWVMWDVLPDDGDIGPGDGLGTPPYNILHNLRTGEETRLDIPYGFQRPFIEEGRWLHWKNLSDELQRVHDLETGRIYTLPPEYGGHAMYLRFSPTSLTWIDESEDTSTIRWITGPSIETILDYIVAQSSP